ncbi:MAG: hypothetical protein DRH37_09075 [Deltaproteobacteria bacterium]|nr:MAG: hypothetical protein DRH37_09075 [Deltaproteobacteria bacterium]
MKKLLAGILLLGTAVFFVGCADFSMYGQDRDPLAEHWRTKARECEEMDDLQGALLGWKVVGSLKPADPEATGQIVRLMATIERQGDVFFKRAVASRRKGFYDTARKEFLTTLRYNPDHRKALNDLRDTMACPVYATYTVKQGDTPADVAREVYNDVQKDFLVSYFLDLSPGRVPVSGTVVRLPVLEPAFTGWFADLGKKLLKAEDFFRNREYEKVLGITAEILKYDSENREAIRLENDSYYQLGKSFRIKRKYFQALKMFKRVDPEYKGLGEAISDVKRAMKKQSEIYYRRGIEYFVNDDLEKAIAEWEKTLALNPKHRQARQDIRKAKNLLEKLKQIH